MNLSEIEIKEATKLDNQLCFPLYAMSRLVVQAYGDSLEKMGITYPQYIALMVLWEKDGATVNEIGERLFLDSGTLTPVLKKLQANGFIQRKRAHGDDRKVQNFLTEKGKRAQQQAALAGHTLFCNSGLSLDEILDARKWVQKLLGKMTEASMRLKQVAEEK